ncbi:DEKNAAC102484 [Brettanomyces naardenensis]|uniref:DEKNAAC102484 n=1 Tax=Brettanomyces naardenensis TaxID=13370 RepID=A0A448YKD8_BRENA|nr:DEKNAAC102484 [Brettanomyces naardenensis]
MDLDIVNAYIKDYKVGPLYIKRLFWLVGRFPDDPSIVPVVKLLLDLILRSDSYYRLFNGTSILIETLGRNGQSDSASKYIRLYKGIAEPYLVSDLNSQMSIVNKKFDNEMVAYGRKPVSQSNFDSLTELLKRKSLDLLMSTGSSEYLSDNTSFYYNVNPQYLNYYRKVSLKELEEYMVFRNYDNSLGQARNFLTRKIEQILAYDKEDLCGGGGDNNSGPQKMAVDPLDNDELVLNGSSIALSDTKLSESEVISYWRCRWYLLYASFLNDHYRDVVEDFDKIATDSESLGKVGACDVLQNHFENDLILNVNLLRIIWLSVLIVKKSTELSKYLESPVLKRALCTDSKLNCLVKSYCACRFEQSLRILNELGYEYSYDYQISRVIPNVQRILRFKAYISYLSLVGRVSVEHMSTVFGVEPSALYYEVVKLVTIFNLHFRIDGEKRIIEYHKDSSRFEKMIEELQSINEEANISSRAMKVNSLVLKALPDKD